MKLKSYIGSLLIATAATLLGKALGFVLAPSDVIMIYLAASVFVAATFGRGPAILFSVVSCACFNFFFVEPLYTFEMYSRSSWLTLLVMLITSIVISGQAINLRKQQKLAQESLTTAENERVKNLLLSSVSHDLRTPLAAITGAASSLVDDNVPGETAKELARSVQQEAQRLSHIVSNLLDTTRLESGALSPNRQPYYIDELIGAALAHAQAPYNVETNVPQGLPLVYVDGLLIEQLLINLLDNAAKYAPADQPVTLSAAQAGDEMIVSVTDKGPGIAPGDEKKVFEKFYRGKTGTAGSGLGLSICDGIIKIHGGRIWAENLPGGGAKFSFTLPVAVSVSEETLHA